MFSIIIIASLIINNGVFAINVNTNWINNTNVNINTTNLFLSELWNNNYKINLQDITADNAWKTIKSWQWKTNFPNKLVLENWFNIEVDKIELDKQFIKTTDLKTKLAQAQRLRVDVWTVNVWEPVLKLLPDRLQLTTETTFKFKTNTQLNNIKKNLWIWLNSIKEKELDLVLNDVNNNKTQEIKTKRDKLNEDLLKWVNESIQKMNMDLDKAMLAWLVKDCQKAKWAKSSECSLTKITNDLNAAEKEIRTNETQEFSLLPPNIILWWTWIIMMNPSDVRLTRVQILDIFKKYWEFVLSNTNSWAQNPTARPALSNETNPYEQANYCSIISWWDETKIAECEQLLKEKNEAKEKVYRQDLLNWFTLWESQRYHWDDSIRVNYIFDSKKLAEASIDFAYNYWFWIRIPIQTEIKIDKSIVDDWENNSKYDIYVKAKTSDAPKSYYTRVWLPEEKTFNWNEFVFELWSTLDIKIRVVWDIIDVNKHFKLISLLAELLKANWDSFFWIDWAELDEVIRNNWFRKSKNFTPPFAWAANVSLFDSKVDVPIYQIPSLFKLSAAIFTDVKLNWIIKSNLNLFNTTDCVRSWTNNSCPDKITFDTQDYKKYSAKAVFNRDSYIENALWQYSNYWISLDKFKYIPELIFEVFVQWKASVKVPILWWESYSTPKIKVFKMTISSDDIALWTHDWTIWVASAKENMVYATNPKIDLQRPTVTTMWDNDRATFEVTNNKSNMIKTYYTLDWTIPNCSDKWIQYLWWKIKIWNEPYNDVVNNKNFNIKVIACTIFWDASEIRTKNIDLRNDSFKFSFSPKISRNLPNITTNQKLEILDSDYIRNLQIRYSFDWTTPTCNSWRIYNYSSWFTLNDLWRDTLQNDFNATVKWIACNNQWRSLNQIMTENYSVHNLYYNPRISLNPTPSISYSRHPDTSKYTTSIRYTTNWVAPTCNIWFSAWNAVVIPIWATVKAVTCIKEKQTWTIAMQDEYNNNYVFKSDVVSKTSDIWIDWWRFEEITDQLRYRLKWQLDDRIFRAFWDFGLDDFENALNNWIDEWGYSIDSLRWLWWLLSDWEMSQFWLVQIWKMYSWLRTWKITQSQFNSQMRGLVSSDDISSNWVKAISSLIKNWSLTWLQIENIGVSIERHFDSNNINLNNWRQNNFRQTTRYSNNPQNNWDNEQNWPQAIPMWTTTPTNDWVQRKYAETKMNGCSENDIVLWDKVWASCNGIQENQNSYTNPRLTDINWWNLWMYYWNNSASCPAWYKIPSISDFTGNIVSLQSINYLKLPASWYYSIRNGIYSLVNSNGLYYWNDQYGQRKEFFFIPWWAWAWLRFEVQDYLFDNAISLRCIRIDPATDSEKWINTWTTNASSWESNNPDSYKSQDEYVNSKLDEIQDNFKAFYDENIKAIDTAIAKLKSEKLKVEKSIISNYNKAITKLEELKSIFILKYKFINDYSNK